MAGNSTLDLIPDRGWQMGLSNLFRAEMRKWWKTRTWWTQCLIWIGAVDLLLLTIITAGNQPGESGISINEISLLYGVFGGFFTTIGVVIIMQSAIVGEKISGTAAWVLSKPVSRAAFVIAKWLANAVGVAFTAILVPGLLAYWIITSGTGETVDFLDFLSGMALLLLFNLYWLTFTLMLGAFYNRRGAVIGIPLALVLGQQFILGLLAQISAQLINFTPYSMVMPDQTENGVSLAGMLILNMPVENWTPVISSIIACVIFLWLGVWRFGREEL